MVLTTESSREVPVSGRSGAPALYQGFDGQYINGSWRPGNLGGVRVDTDPYSGATLAETVMANQGDLDEAYHNAAKAQVSWAARLPAERAAVLEEPVAVEDVAGHRAVRQRVPAQECEVFFTDKSRDRKSRPDSAPRACVPPNQGSPPGL